jgi:hypothetical protein
MLNGGYSGNVVTARSWLDRIPQLVTAPLPWWLQWLQNINEWQQLVTKLKLPKKKVVTNWLQNLRLRKFINRFNPSSCNHCNHQVTLPAKILGFIPHLNCLFFELDHPFYFGL